MFLIRKSLIVVALVISGTFSALTNATEEYRLSAFADVLGYAQIKANDVIEAKDFMATKIKKKPDFLELNNFCVLGVLVEDFSAAIESCEAAIEMSDKTRKIGFSSKKKALASIHSNLAIAKALSGDLQGAEYELQMALTLNSRDSNVKMNIESVSYTHLTLPTKRIV